MWPYYKKTKRNKTKHMDTRIWRRIQASWTRHKGSPVSPSCLSDINQTVNVNMDPNATILRVKRKRGTDPADTLLLACKRIRPETSQSAGETVPEPNEPVVENSVFKLVATVATQVRGLLLASAASWRQRSCIAAETANTSWLTCWYTNWIADCRCARHINGNLRLLSALVVWKWRVFCANC